MGGAEGCAVAPCGAASSQRTQRKVADSRHGCQFDMAGTVCSPARHAVQWHDTDAVQGQRPRVSGRCEMVGARGRNRTGTTEGRGIFMPLRLSPPAVPGTTVCGLEHAFTMAVAGQVRCNRSAVRHGANCRAIRPGSSVCRQGDRCPPSALYTFPGRRCPGLFGPRAANAQCRPQASGCCLAMPCGNCMMPLQLPCLSPGLARRWLEGAAGRGRQRLQGVRRV